MKTSGTTPKQGKSTTIGLVFAALALVAAGLVAWLWPDGEDEWAGATYRVRNRDLVISVLEGGSLISHGSLDIKSQVEGRSTIISIVPDGTMLTEKDVEEEKVIVQLDASDLTDRLTQQEISVQSSYANYTQASEQYEIQMKQNESDISAAELKVKFARMDLEKELGHDLAADVLEGRRDLTEITGADDEADYETLTKKLEDIGLGGNAFKELRRLMADINLADEELKRETEDLKSSEKLYAKGYITRGELEADKLLVNRKDVALKQAKLALELYLRYELPKNAEKLLSDLVEAGRELDRTMAKTRAEKAKAEANLKSNEVQYNNQTTRLEKLKQQVEACTIRAPKKGMVVYASTGRGRWSTPIEEGAEIRERQHIVSVSGPRDMAVEVKVHESAVRKVHAGLPVRIVPDALKNMTLMGKVKSISVLPDSGNWLNPDLKVYNTIIELDETPPDVKPGMSVQVEIIVDTLRNVLAAPIQAVTTVGGQRVCYVVENGAPVMRPVETGESNNQFIEIVSGLSKEENVLLHPPTLAEGAANGAEETDEESAPLEEPPVPEKAPAPPSPAPEQSGDKEEESAPTGTLTPEAEAALKSIPEQYREQAEKRFKAMTPEQQREALKRMSEMGGQGGSDRGGPPGGERRGPRRERATD